MEQIIKAGDVVKIKTGSPNMTVESVGAACVNCVWFDHHPSWSGPFRSSFPPSILEVIRYLDLQPVLVSNVPQPSPVRNENPASWDLVIKDMQDRDRVGEKKYGTRLQPHNGRDALIDAYQESLDLVVYLRTALYERDGR